MKEQKMGMRGLAPFFRLVHAVSVGGEMGPGACSPSSPVPALPSLAARSININYLIILAIFICGGCSQEPEIKISGRWELSENDLSKLRVNSSELTGKIASYRLDIADDNQMMVRIDVEIEGLSKGVYSSTYIWQINDGNLVAKKDTGREFATAINSHSDNDLQIKNGLEPFENFLFSTSNETNEEKQQEIPPACF